MAFGRRKKRMANRLSDMEIDEISLVKKMGNQHSKTVLCKSEGDRCECDLQSVPEMVSKADDDVQDPHEFLRETEDGGDRSPDGDGEWIPLDDLSKRKSTPLEALGTVDESEDDDEEDDHEENEEDDEDDEFVEVDEDTYEDEAEEPPQAKLSKAGGGQQRHLQSGIRKGR